MTRGYRISKDDVEASLVAPSETGRITYDAIEAAQSGIEFGYRLGLAGLDSVLTGGLKPGDLMIVGARPGSGKSFLLSKVLQFNAAKGVPCLFVSAEMTAVQLGVRLFSGAVGIDNRELMEGKVPTEKWSMVSDAAAEMERLPLYLIAKPGKRESKYVQRPPVTINLIHATLEYLRESGVDIKLVAIDYAQRVRSDTGQTTRKDVADEVSSGAKDIALSGTAVVLASQLGRQVEDRIPPKPLESDFKESGNFEEDADIIVTLFNPLKYYRIGERIPKSNPPHIVEPNMMWMHLWKQRLGESNKGWWIYFDPRYAKMADVERELDHGF